MKVALAQTNIIWEDKKKNEQKAIEYIHQSASLGAGAVFFPEMSLTGFSMNTALTAEKDGQTLRRFCEIAREYHIVTGIGWVKQTESLAENHYSVISEQGNVISDYVKIHPFSYADEDRFFSAGTQIVYFQLGGYNGSTFICYDLRFPELFQIASRTADIILIPANWPQKRQEHWECLLRARAIENQCYILAVNCTGEMDGAVYGGKSCCIAADGRMVCTRGAESGILLVSLEDHVAEIRNRFPVKRDRKWDLYIAEYRRQK